MFSNRDYKFFSLSALLVFTGFLLMALDPAKSGFGTLTLWLAPPLLLAGFVLPIFGLEAVNITGIRALNAKQVSGHATFLTALVVYVLTLEPTASLWDCSEFIASAYKLQVPHTPGTPLSLLIGRIFTMLAFGDAKLVAYTLNFMSCFFSAMAVGFLYHLIFHFGRSLVGDHRHSLAILITGASGGALVLAFSDTFWFSAVEAETYGPASFWLLLLIWLIVTGKDFTGPARTRRLALIFYLAGLGYCVHPMCLLAIAILPFAWRRSQDNGGFRAAMSITFGLAIVFLINRLVAIGLFELAFSFDRFAVNILELPFYSGAIILVLSMAIGFRLLLKLREARPYVLSTIFLLMGFTPYLLLFIRSGHNPPIDEFNPENLSLIKAYMNRESYPSVPLLYGPYFDARVIDVGVKKSIYYMDDRTGRYEVAGSLPEYVYDTRQTILPRVHSNDANHIEAYRSWLGLQENENPDFLDNMKFMFTYQLGHMYLRYLLWNFAGRAGDAQDSDWLRPWQGTAASPFDMARNQYWMIPLLLGVTGGLYQFRRDRRGFISVFIFFLITGTVLALYLNSPPGQPRERDYIYVGSFAAFSVWVGIGLIAIGTLAQRIGRLIVVLLATATVLLMLVQNYDDHDRSGRTFHVDNARNLLGSCASNSILFTGGDNDTFPLWYLQEVEGFRTDVRVMVLSYMNSDWYINQLRRSYYDSGAFRLTLDEDDYRQYGPNDVLYVQETIKEAIDVEQFLALLKREHPALRKVAGNGEAYHILPSRTVRISGKDATKNENAITLRIGGNYMSKNLLAILDLAVSNDWDRPIYFNFTSLNSLDADISPYVIQEGPVYRLRPQQHIGEHIAIDTSLSFKNIVAMANYDNLMDSTVNFSYEDHFARIIVPIRQSFNDLASAFLREGNEAKAKEVMECAMEYLYRSHLRPSYTNLAAAEILLALGEEDFAETLITQLQQYTSVRIEFQKKDGHEPSDLDVYLLQRSRELLTSMR